MRLCLARRIAGHPYGGESVPLTSGIRYDRCSKLILSPDPSRRVGTILEEDK